MIYGNLYEVLISLASIIFFFLLGFLFRSAILPDIVFMKFYKTGITNPIEIPVRWLWSTIYDGIERIWIDVEVIGISWVPERTVVWSIA